MRLVARPGATPLGLVFLACAIALAAAVAVLHLDRLPVALCAFKAITGVPCMTCGTTRTLARLATLDLRGAAAMNPLATAVGIALVPWGLADLALLKRGAAVTLEVSRRAARPLRIAALAAIALNWAYLMAMGI
jgi:hypothetical protein